MDEPSPHEHVIRELIEVHGYRPVPRPERWWESPRGRVRAAAWTGLGAFLVLVGVAPAVWFVSETAAMALFVPAMLVLLLLFMILPLLWVGPPGAEEDENERAVARMVSGRGSRRRD
ncbi:MAG TPA: hypothetical protein VL422_16990 [Miltoncostaea sp.]|nr:hypothetical protein [Miltoncostaea sp.]